jgi:pimeloyl-ACP methyl ester carboxylesterase
MTFVLIPGAGCTPYHWHPLTAVLRDRGHQVIPVDLLCDDESAGLSAYVDAVVDAVGPHTDVTLVAHSLGGMTAPLVCERIPVELLVFLAGMIPKPGEPMAGWSANTGYAQVEDETVDTFFEDLPPELAVEARRHLRDQSAAPMRDPSPLKAWPMSRPAR